MATVTYLNENYDCSVALKGADYIHLLDAKGYLIAAFDGITNFSGFTISGGSWAVPASDHDCYIAVIREDGTIGKGGHKCSDITSSNHTHDNATTSKAGFMSAKDKSNLDTVVGRVNQSLTTNSSPTFATVTANKIIGAVYA